MMVNRIFVFTFTAAIFAVVFFLNAATVTAQISKLNPITNPTVEELRKNFKNPHRDFSTGPLWTWNDRLTDEQVRGTLRDLAKQHVRQVWVHPRPGLMTPYLSNEWFDRWKTALDEAKKLDMNVWIYDENSYPSGFAGGFVPEALPDSRGSGLKFSEVDKLDRIDDNILYIFTPQNNPQEKNLTYKNITATAKQNTKLEPLPDNKKYLIAKIQYAPQGGWFGGKWYVDLLKKGVTEKFLDITLDAYKNVPEIQKEFGKRVPGIFTDEPHPAGSYVGTWVTWNDEIPELFEKRFGYSLIDNLPSLSKDVGDWKKIRHNYHQLILDLFTERWAKPYFERCEKYGLEFTGHYWEHGWPNTSNGPDNMAMYIWSHRPAIDLLMNTYNDKSPNAQFGNVRSVKELASAANQMGRSRTLSENYGAGGWDIRFEDLKRLGDWSYALGVNTNNEHLSYVTIRGARKRDHPQSFSYHASWFEGYHVLADYFTRLSYVLSQGRQVNHVVVVEPTTTAWMYQGKSEQNKIGQSFTNFVNALEHNHVEYDLASEDIIKRFGKVEKDRFIIGQANYAIVILPPMMENLNQTTLDLLSQFKKNNGRIINTGTIPAYVDGKEVNKNSNEKNATLLENLFANEPHTMKTQEIIKQAVNYAKFPFGYRNDNFFELRTDDEKSASSVFFHRRRLDDDCDIVFICNTNLANSAKGIIQIIHEDIEEWDLITGEIRPINPASFGFGSIPYTHYMYNFELPPAGSVLLRLSKKSGRHWKNAKDAKDQKKETSQPTKEVKQQIETSKQRRFNSSIIKSQINNKDEKTVSIPPISEMKIRRVEDNVLTLDYVDVNIGDGDERKDIYTWAANRFVFQRHSMGAGNPWDSQVQFKDELITKKFHENSGFEATYHFTLQESIPKNLAIVIERPDLYKIYCNDKEVKAIPNAWQFDKAFGKIDLSQVAQVGENNVKIVAQPMTIEHELEPAYLTGDFSLQKSDKGFIVTPPQQLTLEPNKSDKSPRHNEEVEHVAWLSTGVGFRPDKQKLKDESPKVIFDFGQKQKINVIKIWNYNEQNLKQRGAMSIKIKGIEMVDNVDNTNNNANDNGKPKTINDSKIMHVFDLGKFDLPVGDGSAYELSLKSPLKFKTISFDIIANHNGVTYPITENSRPKDNAFVGLAEVQFFTKENDKLVQIKNVTAKASSELVIDSHDRKAKYLVDGSGLNTTIKPDWKNQGMPFYAGKVAYSLAYNIESQELGKGQRFFVQLPNSPDGWYGSTAQVVVNGQPAGFIISASSKIDVTKFIRAGKNEAEVIIYGTPKNLFGPHHAGKMRGQAWPGSFHKAPQHQPKGEAYDTIGYGLFKPFELIKISQ